MKNLNRANTTVNTASKKYPLTFLLKIKRGVSWSNRRIELDRERVKYFKTEDNELRFNEKLDDCSLLEKHPENVKKFYLLLVSKSANFKEVKISCDQIEMLRQFKKDFDFIQNYKSTIINIQNKTFLIESEKKFERRDTKMEIDNLDNQTVQKSVMDDDNETVLRSVITGIDGFNSRAPNSSYPNFNDLTSVTNTNKEKEPEKLKEEGILYETEIFNTEVSKVDKALEEVNIAEVLQQNNTQLEKENEINEIEFKSKSIEPNNIENSDKTPLLLKPAEPSLNNISAANITKE
jgi:hypothetical protein